MSTTPEDPKTETIVQKKEFDSGAFDAMLKRMAGSAAEGTEPKSFRYRELTLTIPLDALRPETYDEPIKLTLRELSSEAEMRAYRAMGAKSDEGGLGAINTPETDAAGASLMLGQAIAREAVYAVNGRVLVDNYEKDMAWNSLTLQARMAVSEQFFDSSMVEGVTKKITGSVVVS